MDSLLLQAFIYLMAAVVAVPVAKRLGLGSVLGYLIAGVIIGPVVGLVGSETSDLQHFAEFGVVMMLFIVGLELEPKSLWQMRHKLLGLGGLQVLLTVLCIAGIAYLLGLAWQVALAVGMIFSLSSTVMVLQTLNERNLMKTEGGESSFAVLLFQDIAVIPILVIIPLLAVPELIGVSGEHTALGNGHDGGVDIISGLTGWQVTLASISAVAFIVIGGHYLSRPVFRYIARSKLREMFTAAALLLVIGIALLMTLVGLSPALGTFLAGVVLATSTYRHELESDIEPFKGLLLGLFFITVGAGVDFAVLVDNIGVVLAVTIGVMVIKAFVLYLLALVFGIKGSDRWLLFLGLAQVGEFGFVLISFCLQSSAIPVELSQILLLVVALSMLLTPALFILFENVVQPRQNVGLGDLRVFLSYARSDLDAMLKIAACLERNGFEVIYDTRDLPFGEKWKTELRYLIERSDIVVWLVSPSSIESYWCNWELSEVTAFSKKFVPVSVQEVALRDLPEAISERQILPSTGRFNPRSRDHIDALVALLGSDHAWLKLYTRLSDRALAWDASGRDADRLLTPSELTEAEDWRNGRPVLAPEPMPLVLDLIHSSRVTIGKRDTPSLISGV